MGLLHLLVLLLLSSSSGSSMVLLEELQLSDVLPMDLHPDVWSIGAELQVEQKLSESTAATEVSYICVKLRPGARSRPVHLFNLAGQSIVNRKPVRK